MTKLSADIGLNYETGNHLDVRAGIAVGHATKRERYVPFYKSVRHSYQFQYDVIHRLYGFNAAVNYNQNLIGGNAEISYRSGNPGANSLAVSVQGGLDFGAAAVYFGPAFYLFDKLDNRRVTFSVNLKIYPFFLP